MTDKTETLAALNWAAGWAKTLSEEAWTGADAQKKQNYADLLQALRDGLAKGPTAHGAFYFGGKRAGKLHNHCETKEQIEAYIADRHRSDDSNTFRHAPLYALDLK